MEFCAGDRGGGDDFAEAEFTIGEGTGGARSTAHVDVAGGTIFGGDAEHLDDFTVGGGVGVGDAETDGGGTEAQAVFELALDGFDLIRSCFLTGGGTGGEKVTLVAHDSHANGGMADRSPVVNEGFAGAGGIPFGDVGDADFEFEGTGDAVQQLVAPAGQIDAVPVEIDEAGGEDESGAVDFGASFERLLADGGNFAGGDGYITDRVEAAFGVEDTGRFDDQIMWGLGEQTEGQEQTDECGHHGESISSNAQPSASFHFASSLDCCLDSES